MKDETFIITLKSAGLLFHEAFMSIFQNASYTPNVTFQASDLQTVLSLVACGMGVTLTPSPIYPIAGIVKKTSTPSIYRYKQLLLGVIHDSYVELKKLWDNEDSED